MQYPTPQGSTSKTFRAPPLDGTLALHALPEFHAKNSPDHPVFRYEDPSNGGIKTLHWSHISLAIRAAREILLDNFGVPTSGTHPVVAILVNADTMSYVAVIFGLMQAGFVPFPISVRNSAAAVLHVLKETNCTRMIVSHDQHLQAIANMVSQEYASGTRELGPMQSKQMPSFNSMYRVDNGIRDLANESAPNFQSTDTATIFHSSGTTRFPSPIYLNHRLVLQFASIPYYGAMDLCGYTCASQGTPMYHVMGFMWACFMMSSGFVLAVFPPTEPPVVPSSDSCLASATKLGCNVMLTVPSFLEEWSRNPASIEALKAFNVVRYGGGPLSKEAGDRLRFHGVPLITSYGLTEAGSISIPPKTPPSEGWEWMRLAPYVDAAFVPVEENIFRLYVKDSPILTPAVLDAEIDGVRAFDTKDLLIRHPVNPAYYKIYENAAPAGDRLGGNLRGTSEAPQIQPAGVLVDGRIPGVRP
ncbi:acetyl-CoA synthetase-like protein [Hymenopellis radicata]|nr:acetyl-CoA synthetase-like protein [Hymenopellis radicata]